MHDRRRITLALSGGGFRATLFHLGVVRFLRDAKLLGDVTQISAVSGGSVLAAHLMLHWDEYCGDLTSANRVAEELLNFVASDVRGRVLRRWILAWVTLLPRVAYGRRWTLTNLLQSEYRRLFQKGTLAALGRQLSTKRTDRPDIFLNCTSLGTASPCYFDSKGFSWFDADVHKRIDAPEIEASFAVAASSAFPPLFPPISVSHEVLSCGQKSFPNRFQLTDGGVYDNLGIDRLLSRRDGEPPDIVLVSDAGGNVDWKLDESYTSITGRNIRASTLMMKRISDLEYISLSTSHTTTIFFKIDSEVPQSDGCCLSPEIQRRLRNVRTDLDAFSSDEISALVQHGYAVARETANAKDITSYSGHSNGVPGNRATVCDIRHIQRARNRKLRLWSYKDWASWASIIILFAYCFFIWQVLKIVNVPSPLSNAVSSGMPLHVDIDAEGEFSEPAISRDGKQIAFVSKNRLVVRRLNTGITTVLPETEDAHYPFFSSDGEWVVFSAKGKLQKINTAQPGSLVVLCDAIGRGGSWADGDSMVVALNPTGGLFRVAGGGGVPQALTHLSVQEDGADSHRWPQALPNGATLFAATIQGRHGSLQIVGPHGGKSITLVKDSTFGRYLNTGHLIYYQEGSIFGAKFDLTSLKLGPAVPIVTDVAYDRVFGHADFDVSESGTLVYRRGREINQTVSRIDIKGRSTKLTEPGKYMTPRLSPDGESFAVAVDEGSRQNLWIYDMKQPRRRLTFDDGPQSFPVWAPHGGFLAFESVSTLAWTHAAGGKPTDLLPTANRSTYPSSFSPDGRLLAFTQASEQTGWEVWTAEVESGEGKMQLANAQVLDLKTRRATNAPSISPDGHWIAYASYESGRYEVYVTSLLDRNGGKWQVSSAGGRWPVWAHKGQIFYEDPNGMIIVVDCVFNDKTFRTGRLRQWADYRLSQSEILAPFDVSADGSHVIGLFDVADENMKHETQVRVIFNVEKLID